MELLQWYRYRFLALVAGDITDIEAMAVFVDSVNQVMSVRVFASLLKHNA
jgi:predicted ATP-grasp superfamily ATP-dependent carboligase